MDFQDEAFIPHPLAEVFEAFRDRLVELVPYLPAIESIETTERIDRGAGRVRLVNIWQGKRAVAPQAFRPFATSKALRWRDIAEWDEGARATEWRFETYHFDSLFDCHGRNHYEPAEGGTRFVLAATLDVFPERIPGVPRFMAAKIKPKVEMFVRKRVTSNLAELVQGVRRLLGSRGSSPART